MITRDAFLGGRITVRQPSKGFRSGADAVLLASAVPAQPGQSVLELGTGAGVASLCLALRVPGLTLSGLEVQETYVELAIANAADAGVEIDVLHGDLSDPPACLKEQSFDHVLMNPPYYRAHSWTQSADEGRRTALAEEVSLAAWMDAATRRLKPGGCLTLVQKASRLVDVLKAADGRLGSIEIKPVSPRRGRPAELVLVRFKKGGKADPLLYPPLIMHEGDKHRQDVADQTEAADALLRHGEALVF